MFLLDGVAGAVTALGADGSEAYLSAGDGIDADYAVGFGLLGLGRAAATGAAEAGVAGAARGLAVEALQQTLSEVTSNIAGKAAEILLSHFANQAYRIFVANPQAMAQYLTAPQYQAAQNNPALARANFGFAVENYIRRPLSRLPFGRNIEYTGQIPNSSIGGLKPDFTLGGETGKYFDVTTEAQAVRKASRNLPYTFIKYPSLPKGFRIP